MDAITNALPDNLDFLRGNALFQDVPDADLKKIMSFSRTEQFQADEIILVEGESTNDLLIVQEGTVEVYVTRAGEHISIVQLGPQAYFGEMSVFDDYPRSANVRAVSDVSTLRIDRTFFREFLKDKPAVLFQICTVFSHRLRNTNSAFTKR